MQKRVQEIRKLFFPLSCSAFYFIEEHCRRRWIQPSATFLPSLEKVLLLFAFGSCVNIAWVCVCGCVVRVNQALNCWSQAPHIWICVMRGHRLSLRLRLRLRRTAKPGLELLTTGSSRLHLCRSLTSPEFAFATASRFKLLTQSRGEHSVQFCTEELRKKNGLRFRF